MYDHVHSWRRSGGLLWLLLGCLASAVLCGSSRDAHTDTGPFWAAVDNAQARNPKIHRAAADLRVALESNPQSMARLLPNANFQAAKTLEANTRYHSLNTESENTPGSVGVTINQPLLNYSNWLGHQQSDVHIEAARRDLEAARQDMVLQVATVTANWLQAREVFELAENYRKVTKRHLEVNKLRFRAGESTETDVNEASSRASQAEASHADASNTLSQTRAAFREVVGQDPTPDLALPDLPWQEAGEFGGQLPDAIEARADVQAARVRLHEYQIGEEARQAEHLPTVDLSFNSSRTWDSELGGISGKSIKDDVDSHSLMVVLNLPLFKGGETLSKTREARARKEGLLADMEKLRQQAMREAWQARADQEHSRASSTALRQALNSSGKALAGMEEEFLVGTRTLLDLLDAQYEVFSVQTSLVRQRYQEQLAGVRLWKAMGRPLAPVSTLTAERKPVAMPAVAAQERPAPVNRRNGSAHKAKQERSGNGGKADTTWQTASPDAGLPGEVTRATAEHGAVEPEPAPVIPAAPAPVSPAPVPVTAPGSALPGLSAEGPFYVRIGAYQNEKVMAAAERKLQQAGIASQRQDFVGTDGKAMTRVMVGPFSDHASTLQARETIRARTGMEPGWMRNRAWRGAPAPLATAVPAAAAPPPVTAGWESGNAPLPVQPAPVAATPAQPALVAATPARPAPADAVAAEREARLARLTAAATTTPAALPRLPAGGDLPAMVEDGPFLVHIGSYRGVAELAQAKGLLTARNIPSWQDDALGPDGQRVTRLLVGPFADYDLTVQAEEYIRDRLGLPTGCVPNPLRPQ